MKTLNVHQAKTTLSAVLAEIEKHHETVVICRNGKPVADLVPHQKRGRLKADPFLRQVTVKCDLTEPLTEKEWEEV